MLTLGPIPEQSNAKYTAYLTDETDTVIPASDLGTMTLTLRDKATGTVINSRSAQNVLNANNVTVHASSGLVTWSIQSADVTPVNRNQPYAEHQAEFVVTWATGTKSMKHAVLLKIAVIPEPGVGL